MKQLESANSDVRSNDSRSKVGLVVFMHEGVFLHGYTISGKVDFDHYIDWPVDWPEYINTKFLDERGIAWISY